MTKRVACDRGGKPSPMVRGTASPQGEQSLEGGASGTICAVLCAGGERPGAVIGLPRAWRANELPDARCPRTRSVTRSLEKNGAIWKHTSVCSSLAEQAVSLPVTADVCWAPLEEPCQFLGILEGGGASPPLCAMTAK